MSNKGGKREGAGRKKGVRNKKTLAQMRLMRDGDLPLEFRADMAKAAAPYLHHKLGTIEQQAPSSSLPPDDLASAYLPRLEIIRT